MYQTTIFDMILPKYKITKPIRLIEFFSGYGSQALALKYLGVKFEHWKTCEWAVKSIQAYKDIHFPGKHLTFNEERTKEEMVEYLYQKGISRNYNAPMTKEQIKRINEKQLKTIMENIAITNNLVNIQQVKGKDLEIVDTDKYEYILTYSFPCQDLSLAGKGKGMSDTSTRSGMLWEVERILDECKELGTLPQILLMENVPQVHGEGNTNDFNKWQLKLEELGYSNYWEDLIATDYGIPQTRNRSFMVSILGEYSYSFPPKQELKLRLKDMLEEEVDEKYYLTDSMINYLEYGKYKASKVSYKLKQTETGICPTLDTMQGGNRQPFIRVKNATKKGYLEAYDGDGVDISSRMEYHRGTVQKGKIQTITTSGGDDRGVVIKPKVLTGFGKIGSIGQYHQQNRVYDDNVAISVTTAFNPYYLSDLAIRKLTPRECGRLMGVRDEDITNMLKNQSDSSAYHCFGDSIVVDVLMAIFGELL